MAYTKTTWKDRIVEKPLTYTLLNNGDGTTTLIPAEGAVTEGGTAINALVMNNLEKQYDEANTLLATHKASTTDHSAVTTSANGFMSSTDKTKLDGIAPLAEVNQNAFTTLVAGSTSLVADSKSDTVTVTAGTGVTVTGNATTDTMTIAVDSTIETTTGAQTKADQAKTDAINFAKSFGLGDVVKYTPSADLNTINETGFYYCVNGINIPIALNGYLIHHKMSDVYKSQIYIIVTTGVMYSRVNNNGSWTTWSQIETTDGAQAKADAINTALTTHKASRTDHAIVTTALNGFMSSTDKAKLDGIASSANNYVHPTTTGNKHIPSGGAVNQFLEYSADGTAVWSTIAGSQIVEDASHRLITDAERIAWNAKETTTGAQTKADQAETDAINWAKGFGLGTSSVLRYVDLNTIVETGFYRTDRSNVGTLNAPPRVTGDHSYIFIINIQSDTNYQIQLAWDFNNVTGWKRSKVNSVWGAWTQNDAIATTTVDGFMSATDKVKLNGIATSANNYVHPTNHPPSVITQDASNRFVTDAEKATWNGKASTAIATTTVDGLMDSADKVKLNGIATGAQTNQNAFATVVAGATSIVSDSASDTLTVNAGAGISVVGDATADTMTIAVDSTIETKTGAQTKADVVNTALTNHKASKTDHAVVTTSANGFMSSTDKTKLDGIATSANNYVHPTTTGNKHIPSGGAVNQFLEYSSDGTAVWSGIDVSQITESTTRRFVSDIDKGNWNAKETPSGAQTKADKAETDANSFTTLNAQMKKLTSDDGSFKLSASVTTDNILSTILASGTGMHTFYAIAGSVNNPTTNSPLRGYAHMTSSNIGYVIAFTPENDVYVNYVNNGVWLGWNKLVSDNTPTWNNLTLQNGVLLYTTGVNLQYSKIGNVVYIRGAVKNITTAQKVVATLPVDFRPLQNHAFSMPTSNGGTGTTARFVRWMVTAAGVLEMETVSDTSYNAGNWFPIHTSFTVA